MTAMIEPYNAVGLIPTFYGIRRRDDIKYNIEHLKSCLLYTSPSPRD